MKTFSRLSLFTLVCFGLALMFFGNTADVHAQGIPSLQVQGDTGKDKVYAVGDSVVTEFIAQIGAALAPDEDITIMTNGIGTPSVTGVVKTDPFGRVVVTGTILIETGAYIEAVWTSKQLRARADFNAIPEGKTPALIVVNQPVPKSTLQIGDTFTQTITIENRGTEFPTLPLSAWQMDIVFNPLILAVVQKEDDAATPEIEQGPEIELGDALGADAHSIPPMVSTGRISVSQSRAGMPPLGTALVPGETKTLLTIEFEVLAVAEEALGIHNVRLQSDTDDNEDGTLDRISYSILVSDVFVTTHQSPTEVDINEDGKLDEMNDELNPVDVNQDLKVDILDLVVVAGSIGMVPHNPRADVNGDGFVNVLDLISIYNSPRWGKTVEAVEVNEANDPSPLAPSMNRNVDPATIQTWVDLATVKDDGSAIFDLGIANLEALLASQIPSKTKLLLNYPNPFNPETWIPYQLAKAADVTVTIHAMNGSLIRTLELGHQAAGIYKNKSQAAYWDGQNEFGEQVASGLYFYTLTAGKFSATGKMLVRK